MGVEDQLMLHLRIFLASLALLTAGIGFAALPALADGANGDCGNYCPTSDTGHQGNGSAPTDGTVGNADGKNPPGQSPDGSDGNNGYECDSNPGVGDGNPAHTGCSPAPSVSPLVTVSPTPGVSASPEVSVGPSATASPSAGATHGVTAPPLVDGPVAPSPIPVPGTFGGGGVHLLPFTGVNVTVLLQGGLAALALGALLFLLGRRH